MSVDRAIGADASGHAAPAAACHERVYGLTPGTGAWWGLVGFRLVSLAMPWVFPVGMSLSGLPPRQEIWFLFALVSLVLLVGGIREARGLEPVRIELEHAVWSDVLCRLPAGLAERGFVVRRTPTSLQADLRDTFGPGYAFDVLREAAGIVLLGQRATVRWACRTMGARGPGFL